jgi:hypothetical protein
VLACGKAQFEKASRVAHSVAVLFAVMTVRERSKTTRGGFIRGFDDQRHMRRVFYVKVKAVMPSSGVHSQEDTWHFLL